jgi:nudix-type nucleoside diphosphatase (YffH/AdpP family)
MTAGDGRPRILSTEVLWQGWTTFSRITFDIDTRAGERRTLVREIQNHGDSAAVLPFDPQRRSVLLARQFRLAAHIAGEDGMLLEACAGLIDDGETAADAARREAEEELGCRLHDVTEVFRLFTSPGSLTERVTLFSATYRPEDRVALGGGASGEGEDIEVVEMPLKEALAKCARGEIADAKTVILLQHLRRSTSGGADPMRKA